MKSNQQNNFSKPIIGILLLSGLLRLISLNQSFWLDEAINVTAAKSKPLTELLTVYSLGDFHPPLYHFLLWFWFRVFPASELSARVPSLIFGVLTVFLTYKLSRLLVFENKKEKTPLLAALLLATSGLHLYYSQEARMYSLAVLTVVLSVLGLFHYRKQKNNLTAGLLAFSLAAMLYSDYQPWLLLPLFLYFAPLPAILAILMTAPWLPFLVKQLVNGLSVAASFPAWKMVVGTLTLKTLMLVPVKFLVGRISLDNNLTFALLIFIPLLAAATLLLEGIKSKNQQLTIIKLWLLLPFLLSFLLALKIPLFSYFRFLFLLPAFYILLAFGSQRLSPKLKRLALTLLICTNLLSSAAYLFLPAFQREDWRGIAAYISAYPAARTLVVFPNLAQSAGFEYYNRPAIALADLTNLDLNSAPENVFFINYVSQIFDPHSKIDEMLKNNRYTVSQELNFRGINVIRYSRRPS